MPWMSSGLVSTRTRITLCPCAFMASAVSASKTISPDAAPGDAGRPVTIISFFAAGSMVGCRSCVKPAGSTRSTASSRVMTPSFARSTAILTEASVVRLPDRVCSIQTLPFWIVNSMSCMSR